MKNLPNYFSPVGLAAAGGVHRSVITRLQAAREIEAVAVVSDGVGRTRLLFDDVAAGVVRATAKRNVAVPTPGQSAR